MMPRSYRSPYLLALLLIWLVGASPAGATPLLRNVGGMYGVALEGGFSTISPLGGASWSYALSKHWYLQAHLAAAYRAHKRNPYYGAMLQPAVGYVLWSDERRYFLSGLAGMSMLYESRKKNKQGAFNAGLILGAGLEVSLIGQLSLLISGAPTVFFLKRTYGQIDFCMAAGLKLSF